MSSSLLVAMISPLAASAAEGEVAEDRTTVSAEDISRQAFWNGRLTESVPTAVTKQFPPEAACLVAPQVCNFPTGEADPTSALPTGSLDPTGETEDGVGALGNSLIASINQLYTGTIDGVQGADPGLPADPVPPGGLPVSVAFGEAYHRAAIEFALPTVPEGHRIDQFTIYFPQGNPTYSFASPALRQAVLATLTCLRETESGLVKVPGAEQGRCEMAEFEKVAADPVNGLRDGSPLPFQLCPIGEDPVSGDKDLEWTAGRSISETELPTANCLLGSLGELVDIDGTPHWAFDLSLAMASWADGSLPYEGMIFLPGSADNFAFGDTEITYNKQVTLISEGIQYAVATSPKPAPPAPFVPPTQTETTTAVPPPTTTGGSGRDLFGTPPTPAANSPVSIPQSSSPPATTEQPAVAGDTPPPATSQPSQEVVAQPAATPGGSDWYVWLLLIPFLLGAYLLSRSLEEEAVLVAQRSGGAMTRLLERQAAQHGPDLVG